MARHLIIGAGNLGLDLRIELVRRGHNVNIVSLSTGSDIFNPEHIYGVIRLAKVHDVVWYCLGYGSVAEAQANPDAARHVYVDAPMLILEGVPRRVELIFFSTDYAAHEGYLKDPYQAMTDPKSLYARIRIEFEEMAMKSRRPSTTVVRVGSLYGPHKPEKTFPGKLIANYKAGKKILLPLNFVTPTPTPWLAGLLAENYKRLFEDKPTMHHAAPDGFIPVAEWGWLVLGQILPSKDKRLYFDPQRPTYSGIGVSFKENSDHWLDLWEKYSIELENPLFPDDMKREFKESI